MIENNGTTASVSVRTQVTVNRGNYQSEVTSAGFGFEFDLAGATFDEALAELITLEERLQSAAELQAATALGLTVDAESGIEFVIGPAPAGVAAAPAPRSGGTGGGGGGGGGEFAPPKVSNDEKTQVIIAGIAYYDNRPFKKVSETGEPARYQPGAADFRAVDQSAAAEGQKQLWLYEKGSNAVVTETWALLAAAGVEA